MVAVGLLAGALAVPTPAQAREPGACSQVLRVGVSHGTPVIHTSKAHRDQSVRSVSGRRTVTVTVSVRVKARASAVARTRIDECAGMDPTEPIGGLPSPVAASRTIMLRATIGTVEASATRSGSGASAAAEKAARRLLDRKVVIASRHRLAAAEDALRTQTRRRAPKVSQAAMDWPRLNGYPTAEAVSRALMKRINSARTGLGLSKVTTLSTLDPWSDRTAKRTIADLMYRDLGLIHTDLGQLIDAVDDTCSNWGGIGENLAMVYVDPRQPTASAIAASVMASWRGSPPHWDLLTAASDRRASVGIAMRADSRGLVAATATLQVVQARCPGTP